MLAAILKHEDPHTNRLLLQMMIYFVGLLEISARMKCYTGAKGMLMSTLHIQMDTTHLRFRYLENIISNMHSQSICSEELIHCMEIDFWYWCLWFSIAYMSSNKSARTVLGRNSTIDARCNGISTYTGT